MHIAYVHYMHDAVSLKGGPGVHIEASTAALRALGHRVTVVGPAIDTGRTPHALRRQRGRVRRVTAGYAYQPRALLRSLRCARQNLPQMRAARPDIIIARYEAFEFAPIIVSRVLRRPRVWEVNGTSTEIPLWNPELVLYPGTRALERHMLNAGAAIVVVSSERKQQLEEQGIQPDRIAVIPNGADPERLHPDRRRAGAFGAIPDDAVVVGYLGSFSTWHDIRCIVSLIPPLAGGHLRVWFVLAGAPVGDVPGEHQTLIAPFTDRVLLPGAVPIAEAATWMARLDVALSLYPRMPAFCFWPVKLFEYMVSGCAVVATAIGQQARVIQDGQNGLLVPPGDRSAAEESVGSLIADRVRRERLGRAARESVLQRYTWSHNAARITLLCERVLQNHIPPMSPAATLGDEPSKFTA